MNIAKIAGLLLFLPLAFAACGGDDGPAAVQPTVRTAAPASQPEATRAPSQPLPPREATPVPAQKQPTPAPSANSDPYAGFPTFAPDVPPASAPVETTSWRVLSARIFYDQGGGGDLSTVITTRLELSGNGTWTFGSSSGAWDVRDITSGDWSRWGIQPYGPTQKVVLDGWNGGVADGPIEESGGQVDFVWVIYPEGPPTISAPGTVWMKFGRA